MPLFYKDSSQPKGINFVRLYAVPEYKEGGKTYLCSNNNARNANGDWGIGDMQCVFRWDPEGSKSFQIVREKDGWVAGAHDHFVVFHDPSDTRASWFKLEQVFDGKFEYLKLGDIWVCIGERDDGYMYVNLKKQGYWALGHYGSGMIDGERLATHTEVHLE